MSIDYVEVIDSLNHIEDEIQTPEAFAVITKLRDIIHNHSKGEACFKCGGEMKHTQTDYGASADGISKCTQCGWQPK